MSTTDYILSITACVILGFITIYTLVRVETQVQLTQEILQKQDRNYQTMVQCLRH